MKINLIFTITFLISCTQGSPASKQKVHKGKSYFNLSCDKTWIVADRFTTNPKLVDTQYTEFFCDGEHRPGKTFKSRYFITTQRGEQYHFRFKDKSNIWLNSACSLEFLFKNGHFESPETLKGECCIEALDSIRFEIHRNLIVTLGKGSCLNIQNRPDDSMVTVSLIRGEANIDGHLAGYPVSKTLNQPGTEIFFHKYEFEANSAPFDSTRTLAWRNAQYLLFNESNLHEILTKLKNWYDQEISLVQPKHEKSDDTNSVTIAFTDSFETALQKVKNAFQLREDMIKGQIFLYATQ